MKILFVYTGFSSAGQRLSTFPLLEDLHNLSTTHASEVNYLLICYWLKELGHEVTLLSERANNKGHIPQISIADINPNDFDIFFMWKLHGMLFTHKHDLLNKYSWKRVIAWIDALNPKAALGEQMKYVNHIIWGTDELKQIESQFYPKIKHTVCEHATTFITTPIIKESKPHGLYLGRLPYCYLTEVLLAAQFSIINTYALWLEISGGQRILLRPGQYTDINLNTARSLMPSKNINLYPGINVIAKAEEISQACFGLCPATGRRPNLQAQSASKFYDYLALGLPVVLADNTPEAKYIKQNPYLGQLYIQGDIESLHHAINKCLLLEQSYQFIDQRKLIQSWVFNNATYKHRAKAIHDSIQ